MKYFLKKQWIWILCVSLISIITLASLFIKVDYYIITPASICPIENYLDIEESEVDDVDINEVSVYTFYEVPLFNYLIAKINPFCTVKQIPEYLNTDPDYSESLGELQRIDSVEKSRLAAYKEAGYDIKLTLRGYFVSTIHTFHNSDVKINDQILSVDGIKLTEEYSFANSLTVAKSNNQSYVDVIVKRSSEEINFRFEFSKEEEYFGLTGIDVVKRYTYLVSDDAPEIQTKDDYLDSLGPSAGLMQSLYLYVKLTNMKLPENIKITGTGSVDENGNAGLIGGIMQKIYVANASGADIFFVPIDLSKQTKEIQDSNYTEAKKACELLKKFGNCKIKLIPVTSLRDAIEELEKLQ